MILPRIQRGRTVFMTMSLFFLCVMLVLNVMVNQLQNSNSLQDFEQVQEPQREFRNYIAKGRRNPMAANEKTLSDSYNGLGHVNLNNDIAKRITGKKVMLQNQETPRRNTRIIDLQGLNTVVHSQDDDQDEEDNYYNDDYDIEKVIIEDTGDDEEEENDDDDDNDAVKLMQQQHRIAANSVFQSRNVNSSKQVFVKPRLQYKEVLDKGAPAVSIKNGGGQHKNRGVTEDGIYWSSWVEDSVPKGASTESNLRYMEHVRRQNVIKLDPPAWNRCGRPKNGFITLADGSSMCARYRDPHNKMVLGEVLSFYLSRLLGMDNVPAVVLSKTNRTSLQWRKTNFHNLEWKDGKIVALIEWIPNMETYSSLVKIPHAILQAYENKTVIDQKVLESSDMSLMELSELVQWGSMIMFDYLTGNYDRIASMQDAAFKEKKPSILLENIRNLRKSTTTKKLWLIDNESGLLDAYDLMYNNIFGGDKFINFHRDMLRTFCVFQRSMVEALLRLNDSTKPHSVLEHFAGKHDNLISELPRDQVYRYFQTHFRDRVKEVSSWIRTCRAKVTR